MRKKIVAGNWKMNLNADAALNLVSQLEQYAIKNSIDSDKELIVSPPYVYLENISDRLSLIPNIKVAAQNCHHEAKGAYTGEVSAEMLKSIGVNYVIIGHSERRAYFNESEELLLKKVRIALENNLQPIFCCGEQEAERDAGTYKQLIESQLTETIFKLDESELLKCIIAYEPVWAIGTGKTASPQQAQEIHQYIRFLIEQQYGEEVANEITILYGGSCKPNNAVELFSQKDVDGGLIGGASLKAEDFLAIYESFDKK